MRDFLQAERALAGWRFVVLWVAATNLGFFPGLRIGELLADHWLPDPTSLIDAALHDSLITLVYIALVSALQALVLARHSPAWRGWVMVSIPGFTIGIFVGVLILDGLASPLGFWPRTILLGGIAGAVAGVPLWLVLRRHLTVGLWWVPLNALAWLVFFPGFVTGLALRWTMARR